MSGQRARQSMTMRASSTSGGSGTSTRWCCAIAIILPSSSGASATKFPRRGRRKARPLRSGLPARVRSLDSTRPLTEAFPGATYGPNPDAVFPVLDVGGYNYNLAQNQAEDHRRVPGRIMMTTESLAADCIRTVATGEGSDYVLGEFLWTAMDYLGESGIGSWILWNSGRGRAGCPDRDHAEAVHGQHGSRRKEPIRSHGGAERRNPILSRSFSLPVTHGMRPTRATWTLPAFVSRRRTIATSSGTGEIESSPRFGCLSPRERRSSRWDGASIRHCRVGRGRARREIAHR